MTILRAKPHDTIDQAVGRAILTADAWDSAFVLLFNSVNLVVKRTSDQNTLVNEYYKLMGKGTK